MTFNLMGLTKTSDGWNFLITGPFNGNRTSVIKRASNFGNLDDPIDSRLGFLGFHGFFKPAET